MSALRLSDFSPSLANHRVMSGYGMVVGWLVVAMQPPLLALCTTRPAGLVPALSVHVREHVAMFIGMALGNLVSIAVASRVQRTHARWAHAAGRGMRCFFLMSVGMVLGSVTVGDLQITVPGGPVLSAMSSAMLVGMLLGVLAEQLCERGLHLARTAQQRGNARLGQREHSA